jgi:quercetin dioxygenase-like cupin family protein
VSTPSRERNQRMSTPKPAAKMAGRKVYDAAELAQYAEGSIVSRTLVTTDGGTVTVFAFDAGQGLSEHTAPFDALVQVLDGEGEVVIGGEPFRVGRGQMILMPADVPHAVNAGQRFKMMLTMLRQAKGLKSF